VLIDGAPIRAAPAIRHATSTSPSGRLRYVVNHHVASLCHHAAPIGHRCTRGPRLPASAGGQGNRHRQQRSRGRFRHCVLRAALMTSPTHGSPSFNEAMLSARCTPCCPRASRRPRRAIGAEPTVSTRGLIPSFMPLPDPAAIKEKAGAGFGPCGDFLGIGSRAFPQHNSALWLHRHHAAQHP
jgi:hypothetical protein